MFYAFIDDDEVELVGAEAGGRGPAAGEHASSLSQGKPGVLHGSLSYVLQDDDGQTQDVHSISAGLDYPGVGPEHSYWKDCGRVRYDSITDAEALEAYRHPGEARRHPPRPGIEPRRGPGHQGGPPRSARDSAIVVCLSGRGDKDAYEVARLRGEPI